jgi:hypothetical protein
MRLGSAGADGAPGGDLRDASARRVTVGRKNKWAAAVTRGP